MTQSYITIKNNSSLELKHESPIAGESCNLHIDFMRTLRIPDDNKKYNLPPGIGQFPLKHVEDYKNVPESWKQHGGILLPMYQSEAMWLNFRSKWPFAIKIAAGKINAVSGEPWNPTIQQTPLYLEMGHDMLARSPEDQDEYMKKYEQQKELKNSLSRKNLNNKPDYIVSPKQKWLDGFNVGKGLIRQFVAMPLGEGYTVEEQLTGEAEHGGIQIIAYPMKKEYYQKIVNEREQVFTLSASGAGASQGVLRSRGITLSASASEIVEMGLGAGGFMKQDIYDDPYGVDAWDLTKPLRIFVHLANSLTYEHITGEKPPTQPLTPKDYKSYGFPWFDYYDDGKVLEGSDKLSKVDSIASLQIKKDENVLGDNSSIHQSQPIVIGNKTVKNGNW